jgi:hypothetical protein
MRQNVLVNDTPLFTSSTSAQWFDRWCKRCATHDRLVELDAPPVLIDNAVQLCKRAWVGVWDPEVANRMCNEEAQFEIDHWCRLPHGDGYCKLLNDHPGDCASTVDELDAHYEKWGH